MGMKSNSAIYLEKFKEELDTISPTFCVAKWKQVTVHLESGLTHSCHHPVPHKIPLDELKNNKTALHNTQFKKEMRLKMLQGEVVPECDYCNRIPDGSFSDRIYKSKERWSKKYIDEIKTSKWDDNTFPSYFEVSFSSVCNCSCMYCSPTFSSKWSSHIDKFGGYPTEYDSRSFNETPKPEYLNIKNNPYLEAFWAWWPELYENLDYFRITGGEPLLSQDTFDILDYMITNPKPDLRLSINSNLNVGIDIFNKFLEKYKKLSDMDQKYLNVFTSCEAYGKKAEYIRHGLDYNYWLDNCYKYLTEVPNGSITFMCAYNILSISSFTDYLKDILKLKQTFPMRVKIDIPYLTNPSYLQASIISKDFLETIKDSVTFMLNHRDDPSWKPLSGTAFWDHESDKLKRTFYMIEAMPEDENCRNLRKNFKLFIDEYDKRYNTQFIKVFPEYEKYYKDI